MKVVEVNDDNFEAEVINATVPVLVDFWAPWCGPCKQIAPIMDMLAEQYGERAKIVKIDVDVATNVARKFGIRSIPNVFLFHEGEKKANIGGSQPQSAYAEIIDNALTNKGEVDVLTLLKNDDYRMSFIMSEEIEKLKSALQTMPEIASKPFPDGMTPIKMLLLRKRYDRVDVLLTANPTLTFSELVGLGKVAELEAMKSANPSLDLEDVSNSVSALMLAVHTEQMASAKWLLEQGVDANFNGERMGTPFILATSYSNYEMTKLLLEYNGDLSAMGRGDTPLIHVAAIDNFGMLPVSAPLISLLISKGVDKTAVNAEGLTVLEAANAKIAAMEERAKQVDDDSIHAHIEKLKGELSILEGIFN